MNTTLFNLLIKKYNALVFTHYYIFGYAHKGTIYASFATSDALPYVCTLDKASRDAGYSLRFKPNKEQKEYLKTFKTVPLCSVDFFEEEFKKSIYNRGEIFERMVTEYFGQTWTKDNVPFTKAGDITVNGTPYQIKFEKATFVTEKTLTILGIRC